MSEQLLEQLVARSALQDQRIEQLLQQIKSPAPVQYMPAPVNDGNVRKEKVKVLI